MTEEIIEFAKLSRDIRNASATLSDREARYLVDLYYQLQEYRKASANQVRSMEDEPHVALSFFADQMHTMEKSVAGALDRYSAAQPLGQWARGIIGIGPVITAGLLAHIDMNKAPTAGCIWRFAGLDPTSTWDKGEKRPWNANLKTLCWKIGESFVKVSGNEKSYYGKVYRDRKEFENHRNEQIKEFPYELASHRSDRDIEFIEQIDGKNVTIYQIEAHGKVCGYFYGGNAKHAADKLRKFKIGKDTDAYAAYSVGKLPPAHIHARAKRYAVKLFLAHYHEQGYRLVLGQEPPLPYPIAHLGHTDIITAEQAS
jgi:hypothetical protein